MAVCRWLFLSFAFFLAHLMAERGCGSVVMEFSPSEVFIPHSKETLLQLLPLSLVAYVAVCAGDGGGWGRPRGGGVRAVGKGETGI